MFRRKLRQFNAKHGQGKLFPVELSEGLKKYLKEYRTRIFERNNPLDTGRIPHNNVRKPLSKDSRKPLLLLYFQGV